MPFPKGAASQKRGLTGGWGSNFPVGVTSSGSSKLPRGNAVHLLENPAKVRLVLKTRLQGYGLDRIVGPEQEIRGQEYAQAIQVVPRAVGKKCQSLCALEEGGQALRHPFQTLVYRRRRGLLLTLDRELGEKVSVNPFHNDAKLS